MKYIAHRVNTIQELKELPTEFGVEIDLRDYDNRLVLHHDPFSAGDDFEEYLKEYKHGLMILNIKSERIEHKVLELVQQYKVREYFFLDSTFPMIYLLSQQGESNIALRFSEFEGIDTLRTMQGKVQWVWVDCFTKLPFDFAVYQEIKNMGYKFCLVSPELQGRPEEIEQVKQQIQSLGIQCDAICSKSYNYSKWMSL